MGDFNEIISQGEKQGERIRGEMQMDQFRRVLEWGNLTNLGWVGNKFSWCNGHEENSFIKERLDRVVANPAWLNICTVVRNEVLVSMCLDHSPLLLSLCWGGKDMRGRGKNFRYELSWDMEEGCKKFIEEEWGKGEAVVGSMNRVQKLLLGCRSALSWWSRNLQKDKVKAMKVLTKQLKILQKVERQE